MRRLPRLLALCLPLVSAIGCAPCRTSSQCGDGYICDFDTGDCLQGCTSNADCGGRTVCNMVTGTCQLPPTPVTSTDAGDADSGSMDVGTSSTSTTADAGA